MDNTHFPHVPNQNDLQNAASPEQMQLPFQIEETVARGTDDQGQKMIDLVGPQIDQVPGYAEARNDAIAIPESNIPNTETPEETKLS